MTRIPAIGPAIAAGLLTLMSGVLTACGSTDTSASQVHTTTSIAVASPDRTSVDAAFLATVRPALPGHSDTDLIGMGLGVCGVLSTGADWQQLLSTLLDEGLSASTAGTLSYVAVAAYCPQHKDRLPSAK
jgi:Protein of unknown function (DUF732)